MQGFKSARSARRFISVHAAVAHRRPLKGSVAETYVREARHYDGPLPPTLGFLEPSKPEHHPCLIAAFGKPGTGVNAVYLTKLKPDGSGKGDDIPRKKQKIAIGGHCGLPVIVAPINDLLGLAICEGIEDKLSAAEVGLGSWAACGSTFMPKLAAVVPSYVECVTVCAHDDVGLKMRASLNGFLSKEALRSALMAGASP